MIYISPLGQYSGSVLLLPLLLQGRAYYLFGLAVFQKEADGSHSPSVHSESYCRKGGQLIFTYFSLLNTSREPNTLLTSSRDLLAPLEYSYTVAGSLVSCRSKSHANRKPQKQTTNYRPPFTPKALEDCSAVRLKANNVPTAHVHILCGSAAFPQSLAMLQGGKGLSYMRAGRLLCVTVIHVKLYQQLQ